MKNHSHGTQVFRLFAVCCLLLSFSVGSLAQSIAVKGVVKDETGEPVIGASIMEKGTTNGTISDFDGKFSLDVSANAAIVISYIGYKSVEVKASSSMEVTLEEDNEMLEEVVVIGYGTVKRKDVTTAVSTVSTDDIQRRP